MPYSHLELAEAFIKTGELTDALEALDAHLESNPGDDAALRLRAAVRLRTGDLAGSLTDVEAVAAPTTDDHLLRSVILERIGDLEAAIEAMEQARDLQPHNERSIERLLGLLLKIERVNQAKNLLTDLPQTWRWRQWEGDIERRLGNGLKAVSAYSDALNLLAKQFDLTMNGHAAAIQARLLLARADAYSLFKQYDDAEVDYVAAAKIIPDDPLIPFKRGLLAAARGDLERAVGLCREAFNEANPTLRASMEYELQLRRYRELAEKL